ncbi:MAG TPA: hypothetical protein VF683_07430 [Chthoniobacterales bacterium]
MAGARRCRTGDHDEPDAAADSGLMLPDDLAQTPANPVPNDRGTNAL